jgi:hypothetical protein
MNNKKISIRIISKWKRGAVENGVQILMTAAGGTQTDEYNRKKKNKCVFNDDFL